MAGKTTMTEKINPRIDDYDWEQAFTYATNTRPVIGYAGDLSGFTRKDVRRIIAIDEGENDGPSWIALLKLRDGRCAFLSAGCDYTGWDCQAGGDVIIGDDLKHLVKFGLDEESRTRLGFGINGRRLKKAAV